MGFLSRPVTGRCSAAAFRSGAAFACAEGAAFACAEGAAFACARLPVPLRSGVALACAVVFAVADLDVAGAPARRWGFAAFATEALFFVSFVAGEVEVTAVFTVAFAAAFLAAFVVVVSASPRGDPARRREPEGATSFGDDWELVLLGAARCRAAAL